MYGPAQEPPESPLARSAYTRVPIGGVGAWDARPEPAGTGRGTQRIMARSMWRGAIQFGLVTIPVRLYLATESRGISFNMLQIGRAHV